MTQSDATSQESRFAWWQAIALIAAATAVRLVLAARLPLVADEAYYWDWSRKLAFGYFDHPPVIAWLIAGGVKLFGLTTLGVRLLPVLCGAVASLALAATARTLAGGNAARFAALLLACTPFTVGFVLATPDAPLLTAVSVTLWAVVRAVDASTPKSALGWWVLAGLAAGLGMASKFTAVLVPFAVLIALAVHPQLRVEFRRPGPYVAVLVASLVMLPVLKWNADHQWIAFRFQLGHGLGAVARGSWWQRELSLIGGQAGLATPILFVLLLASIRTQLLQRLDARRFTLAVVATTCLLFFVYSATRRGVEANWPAIGWWPALALLAAATTGRRTAWQRRGVVLAAVLTFIVIAHTLRPFLPIASRRDPAGRMASWETIVNYTQQHALRALDFQRPMFAAATRYQDAAMLAWSHPAHPPTMSVNLLGRRNQYDLWPQFPDVAPKGSTLILLISDTSMTPAIIDSLSPHFRIINPGFVAPIVHRGDTIGVRRTWALADWRGTWPADSNHPLRGNKP